MLDLLLGARRGGGALLFDEYELIVVIPLVFLGVHARFQGLVYRTCCPWSAACNASGTKAEMAQGYRCCSGKKDSLGCLMGKMAAAMLNSTILFKKTKVKSNRCFEMDFG
jgi:hypothetical protein